ncbi:unnamed protein product, partial [marine sediment metagenome]
MNHYKHVQVWDAIHLKLRKLALTTEFNIKDLASAIILEATRDEKFLAIVLKNLKQDA